MFYLKLLSKTLQSLLRKIRENSVKSILFQFQYNSAITAITQMMYDMLTLIFINHKMEFERVKYS